MNLKVYSVVSAHPDIGIWFALATVSLLLLFARQQRWYYRSFVQFFLVCFLMRLLGLLPNQLGYSWWYLDLPYMGNGLLIFFALGQFALASCLRSILEYRRPWRLSLLNALLSLAILLLPLVNLVPGWYARPWLLGLPWLVLAAQLVVYLVFVLLAKTGCKRRLVLGIALGLLTLLTVAIALSLFLGWQEHWLASLVPGLARLLWLYLGFSLFALSLHELAVGCTKETLLDEHIAGLTDSVTRFIPMQFLEQLSKASVSELHLGDHIKKDMTIFFSDIRSFTELSEVLTPEENFAFINSYLSRMVPLVDQHGGFVDKYMGDGIMALFPRGDGADGALRAAVSMQRKINEYNEHRAKTGYRSIGLGVGIHTGTLMLGVVGVDDRMEGTVVSDAVNLSSRLQSIAKAFNLAIVISEATFMALTDAGNYKYRFIGKVRVKGKAAPVSVFEIFDGLANDLFERKMRSNTFFEQGMLAYYQKEYSEAVFFFKRALEAVPEDGAARFYLDVCLRKTMAR